MPDWSKIEQNISASIGQSFQLKKQAEIAGGDINQVHQIEGILVDENRRARFFIKSNQKNRLGMFEAETEGLQEIEKVQAIRVPHVVCSGVAANKSYLVLENLKLAGGAGVDVDSAKRLGQQLAAMHQTTSSLFGWSRDNTIGSTRQLNKQTDSWIDFWREQRLGFQLELAKQNGCGQSLSIKGEKLLTELEQFFTDYEAEASLLHGDLWSGNYGYLEEGEAVIFDPAVYYGDRETDIAMTELFGGFPAGFYSAYNEAWPLDKGYPQRRALYNLYHILNHFNLFGGGYAVQAENMIDRLLGQL